MAERMDRVELSKLRALGHKLYEILKEIGPAEEVERLFGDVEMRLLFLKSRYGDAIYDDFNGFLKFAEAKKLPQTVVRQTISHDIVHAYDPLCTPRVKGYAHVQL